MPKTFKIYLISTICLLIVGTSLSVNALTYYGNQFLVNAIVSMGRLDALNKKASLRFTAQASKTVNSFWVYIHNNEEGSKRYRYGIQANNGGIPSGTWLGYKDLTVVGTGWVETVLTPGVSLTSGTVYHIVVEPVDTPNKYLALRMTSPLNRLIVYDQTPDPNSNTLFNDGTGWTVQGYQPLYFLEYSDATCEGNPCSNPSFGSVYDNTYESERFTLTGGDKTITQVGVYLKRVGTPPNDCRFVLYNITDAVEVDSGTIATSSEITTSYAWYTYTLPTPKTLLDGKQYRLYLKTTGGDSSNKYIWHMLYNYNEAEDNSSRNYGGLNSINQTSYDGGASWSDWLNFDAVFRIAYQATYYVRPDGNDANTGLGPSASKAWKTIGKAASTMKAGETVYVAPGSYGESVSVGSNGSSGKRINYIGDRNASKFSDISAGEVITSRFSISSKSYITIDGFTIRNYSNGSGIEVLGTGNNYLIIRNNKIYSHGYDGIHLRYADNIEIYNNLIYDNDRHGINLFYTSNNARIYNNTFYLNADVSSEAAIKLNQGQNATIFNNIFYESIGYCIYVSDQTGFASDYNDFYGGARVGYWSGDRTTLVDWCGASPQTDDINHAINSDPQFVDPDGANDTLGGLNGADDDFHLQSTSPCIEAGTSSFNGKNAPADDIDGEVRPCMAEYDVGSDEVLIALSITLRNAADTADYTTWAIGSGKELNTVYLMDINNCVLVKNNGDVAEDFSISAVGSNWTLGSSSGEDTCVLMGLFNGNTAPLEGDFSTVNDLIGTSAVWATQTGGSGKFEGTNDGDNVPTGTGEKLYIYLRTPTAVKQGDQEAITVTIGCRAH